MPKPKETTSISVAGQDWERIPVQTHLIGIKESLEPIFRDSVKPQFREGDFIAVTEKIVTISQGRVVHISVVKPSLLARALVKGVKKYKNDVGFERPEKMQVAIWQAGYLRTLVAGAAGVYDKLTGNTGHFWKIAGHRISEIDGFNPDAMAPFDEYAMIGPEDPDAYCRWIEDTFGMPAVIIDGNNIDVQVLGASKGLPVSRADARQILLDNPMGQGDEKMPIMIVRRKDAGDVSAA